MAESQPQFFSDAALAVLDAMRFDPGARAHFEYLSGGLLWSDEFPKCGTSEWLAIAPGHLYSYLLAYRASITLGPERAGIRELWEQVVQKAPNWPGLRPERRGPRALRRLQAALRIQEKCFARLEAGEDIDL